MGLEPTESLLPQSLLAAIHTLETRPTSDPFCEPFAASSTIRYESFVTLGNSCYGTMHQFNIKSFLAQSEHFRAQTSAIFRCDKPLSITPKLKPSQIHEDSM